ncbi:hypothetical protein [Modestobacter caceresii]|uniref:hypothetical protein n=1 Tax=Modestobacter caceresii TaxID=1522368 RepID=UPI00068AB780|nr:hypothetical protein [Modestobacter caceresii]
MSSQPINLRPLPGRRTADLAHRRRDLHRLLTLRWALGGRLITAQAHGGADDHAELADTVAALEDALDSRHPLMWHAIEADLHLALLDAEHPGDRSTPTADCLVCRRLADGLPNSIRQLVGLGMAR